MELKSLLIRWDNGQFCLIRHFKAVGNPSGRYYTIRFSVGTEYGYMVKYSPKVVKKIFSSLQKRAASSQHEYQLHIPYTSPNELVVMPQHLPAHDLQSILQHTL
jgi:hypothetical protein